MIIDDNSRKFLEKSLFKILRMQGFDLALSPEEEVAFLYNCAEKDAETLTFFDVGANTGAYAQAVLNIFPQHTHVHCFEPGAATFAQLSHTINALPEECRGRVFLHNTALGKLEGTQKLYYNHEGSALASLYKRRLDHFNIYFDKSEDVTVTTLELHCAAHNIERIDVLKLDVEGNELDVLHGAQALFDAERIGLVQFEFGGCNMDSRTYLQDFYYFFQQYGYFLFRMCPHKNLIPLFPYDEYYEIPIFQNILAYKGTF